MFNFLLSVEAEIVHPIFNQTELSKSNANKQWREKNCEDEH